MQSVAYIEKPIGCYNLPNGDPVWPAVNPQIRHFYFEHARRFGVRLKAEERVLKNFDLMNNRSGYVLCVSSECEGLARVYAHLTNRHLRIASTFQFSEYSNEEVVVGLLKHITDELLNQMYSSSVASHPGIITGCNLSELEAQVLKQSFLSHLYSDTTPSVLHFTPFSPSDEIEEQTFKMIGSDTTAVRLREAIAKCDGIFSLHSHSDGLDGYLLKDLTLCPLQDKNLSEETLLPDCVKRDRCNLYLDAKPTPSGDSRFMSVSEIQASVMLHAVCFGLVVHESTHWQQWSLMRMLLNNAMLGALVTSWDFVYLSYSHILGLAKLIQLGMPLGQVVSLFNNSAIQKKFGNKFCLLGDPRTSFANRFQKNEVPSDLFEVLPRGKVYAFYAGKPFSIVLKSFIKQNLKADAQTPEFAATVGSPLWDEVHSFVNEEEIRAAHYFMAFETYNFMRLWYSLEDTKEVGWTNRRCLTCGSRTAKFILLPIQLKYAARRRLMKCTRCGLCQDMPEYLDIQLQLPNKKLKIIQKQEIKENLGNWDVRIVLKRHAKDKWEMAWPRDEKGRLYESVDLEPYADQGRYFVLVSLVKSDDIAMACAYVRF